MGWGTRPPYVFMCKLLTRIQDLFIIFFSFEVKEVLLLSLLFSQ